ncbi:hypothetical protein [Luteipulveratus halotolerans]|uniref:hypothetical protein n=1 Tax=Luteipulveratus halotolerans TaxID=1631356 RepID=UPI00068278EC|nr:hypothetical protein [Luteipulveratus halotolerans]
MATFDATTLQLCGDLRRTGIEPTRALDPTGAASYVSVGHGVCMPATRWHGMDDRDRHRALVHAHALGDRADERPVFAHESAAALWGLPLLNAWPEQVHTVVPARSRRKSSTRVRRHHTTRLGAVERDGLQVTPAARTVVDVARTTDLAAGLVCADAALRRSLCSRQDLEAEVAALPPRLRGRRVAKLVVALADPLSESAGESLSRAQMFLLRLPRPHLQVEYADADGFIGRTDFGWDGLVGEFDGKVKYRVDGLDGKAAAEVLWREKRREDRLRRQVRGVARWVWCDARDRARLLTVLTAAGLRQEARSTWLD